MATALPGVQINRFCASGLDAVNFAAAQIMSGQQDMAIGGGVESMSRVGIGASGGAWAVDPSIAVAHYFLPQGISADLIATKYGFSRDDVDAYAVESQKRAATAWEEGRFGRSVMPVKDVNGLTILAKDEHMRPGTTHAVARRRCKPSFVQMGELGGFDAVAIQAHPEVEFVNHVHHAGNSSGIVDGAAAVLVGNKRGRQNAPASKPRARIRAFANIGSDPAMMLTGPVDVTEKVLKRAGMTLADIDLIEINEAFASVVLRYMQAFDLDSAQDQRQRRRHRARSSARRHRRDDPRHRARRTGAARSHDRRWSRSASAPAWAPPRSSSGCERRCRRSISRSLPVDSRTDYPAPFDRVVVGRERKRLGNAAGLDQFGVNLTTLKPGAASALRHWHEKEDEFVYVLEGEVVLIEDGGETVLKAGDAAGFKANSRNGHHLVNRSDRDAVYLEIGTRSKHERAEYPDVDLVVVRDDKGMRYTHKNGDPYRVISLSRGGEERRRNAHDFQNFTLDIDADGIALVTWNMPGRIDERHRRGGDRGTVGDRRAGRRRRRRQGRGHHLGQGHVLRRRRSHHAGNAEPQLCRVGQQAQGEEAANARLFDESRKLSQLSRRIETCGKPWVAALNGTALGGGFELALACHHRVAADNDKTRLGLPEIKVGLFPGAGGTQRIARMLPPADALQFLLKGDQLALSRAKAMKLIDAVVPPGRSRARPPRTGSRPGGSAKAPWDVDGFKLPGGPVYSKAGMMVFPPANAIYRRETYDNYPAARAIMQVVYEGLQLPMDQALRVESRWFAKILRSPEAAAMIRSLFVSMQELNKGARRPADVPAQAAQEDRRARRRLHGRAASPMSARSPASTWC